MPDSTILVTGGAGFIGSALVRFLVDNTPHTVVTVDKLTYAGTMESLNSVMSSPRHHFRKTDICDAAEIGEIFQQFRPDVVFHLAAESHVDRSIDGPAEFISTNIVGTYVLLSAATRHWESLDEMGRARFRFLQVSTDEVFGSLGEEGVFTEETPYDPRSPYSASKASSDHLARAWYHTYGLPTLVTNTCNNYGPYQYPEKLIPLCTLKALRGEPIPVYGAGLNVRDWIFVDDHVRGLVAAWIEGSPGGSYNIGSRAELTNLSLVQEICSILDERAPLPSGKPHNSLITFVEDRPGHDLRYAIDPEKAEQELHWRPEVHFGEGLRLTVDWYLENQDWCRAASEKGYSGQRLGLAPRQTASEPE